MTHQINTDIVIIGAGIAGLWLCRRLSDLGYSTLLLEKNTLGGGQSVKSQGIIHGGTKYALSGNLTKASECIAGMPQRWRECLQGQGEIDLHDVRVLSDHQYMWSTGGLSSKFTTFMASKALRGRVDPLKTEDFPEVFRHKAFKGSIYKLNELVLDVCTLMHSLSAPIAQRCIKIDWEQAELQSNEAGEIEGIRCDIDGKTTQINAQRYVLSAGEGTAELLEKWGLDSPKMQIRPLHMCMVKHKHPFPLYAHCIGSSIVPRITVTSHPTDDGQWVWYLGGDLAETGVKRDEPAQIKAAQKELKKLMPWLDMSEAQWSTLRVNRAEPKQSALLRPDAAFCQRAQNGLITWPTKLALAPNLSDEVIKALEEQGIKPKFEQATLPVEFKLADVCEPFWAEHFRGDENA